MTDIIPTGLDEMYACDADTAADLDAIAVLEAVLQDGYVWDVQVQLIVREATPRYTTRVTLVGQSNLAAIMRFGREALVHAETYDGKDLLGIYEPFRGDDLAAAAAATHDLLTWAATL